MSKAALALTALLGLLWGCAMPPAALAGAGALVGGTAALLNADVSAIKAYCEWRGCK